MTEILTRLPASELAARLAAGDVSAVEVTQAHLDRIAAVDGGRDADGRAEGRRPRLPPGRERAGAGGRRRRRRRPRPRRVAPDARRRPHRRQGRPDHEGHPDDVRQPDPARLGPAVRRHRRPSAARAPAGDPRQDQHGRVRHGLLHRALGVRPDPQPLGHRPHPRRLRRRLGRLARRLRGAARHRHRHRRLHSSARCRHRHRRGQADVRGGQPVRARRPRQQPRPGRTCARSVLDAALLHEVIAGHDPCDSTSLPTPVPDVVAAARHGDVAGLRIGIIKELPGPAAAGRPESRPGSTRPWRRSSTPEPR